MDDADLDLLLALADEAEEEPLALRKQESLPTARGAAGQPHPSATVPRGAAPTQAASGAGTGAAATALNGAARGLAGLQRSASLSGPSSTAPLAPPRPAPARPQPSSRQIFDGYLDSISGFRVSKPVIGSLVLKERLTDDCVYIGLKDISPSREFSGRWATMAVLVSKVQATGRDGSPYSRWTLSDLAGKQVTLFLWRKAASDHYKELEGSLLLLWSPQVKRDEGGGGGAGFSLHIDKPEMLQRPGLSADFGLCRGTRKDGQRCTMPINKSSCEYCPYHAQAALRALSSNRSDMAGANLLQRQLLPQARAAQKQLSATTGKPLGDINSLIARPPPPKLLPGGGGGGSSVRSMSAGGGASGGALAAAMAAGTGAYGVNDGGGGCGDGGGGAAVGGKRSYGAQLLANLQERQASLEADGGGGPAAKRRRSSTDPWDDKAAVPVSAAKARAIAAAKATGQLGRSASDGSGAAGVGTSTRTPSAGAATPAAGARRPTSLGGGTTPRIPMPPPLPAHIASLLRPPAAGGGGGGGGSEAGRPSTDGTPANQQQRQQPQQQRRTSEAAPGSAGGRAATGGADKKDGEQMKEEEEDLLVIELDGDDDAGAGRDHPGAAAPPRQAAAQGQQPDSGTMRGAGPRSVEDREQQDIHIEAEADGAEAPQQHQQQPGASGQGRAQSGAAADGGGGSGGGGSSGQADDDDGGCSLDELLELFPELQGAEEGEAEAAQLEGGAGGGGGGAASCAGGAGSAVAAAGAAGGGVRAGTTGAPAAAATGLLPRVAGLSAPPAARAAEARKQQAAATKARNEKMKTLGLKTPAGAPPPKPLGAANASSGAYGGGARPQGAGGAAGAAALAAAKGLPMPRAAAGRAAAAATQQTAAGAAGPSSALAAAFGNLVQQLPETAVESRYTELSEEAAGEAVLSMLEGLEARDALVQQLDSITHLNVTAWHCAECSRLSEYMDKQCRAEGHTLSKTSTLKRFWTCDHCNARITTLGVRFPANRCSRCNNPSLDFTACTMYRGPRELKPAGMAAASGLASKENLFATIESHPEIGRRTFR